MKPWLILGLLLAVGCSRDQPVQRVSAMPVLPGPAPMMPVPTGATVGSSAFATVTDVPVPDYSKTVAPAPGARGEMTDWMWRAQGLTIDQARKRMAALHALESEFERLRTRLQAEEPDNYTGAQIVYLPDWAYQLHFKRDPEATLARYTNNPRFKAAPGRHTPQELDALIKPWLERFARAGISPGYGRDGTVGTASFMMNVTEDEYRAVAAREGWGPVPDAIRLSFVRRLAILAVDPRVAPLLRAFANDSLPTMLQPEAGFEGRIVLRDGCLRLVANDGQAPLAYFHHETGIGLDEQGYLALIDRRTGKPKGRIGETFVWAGPNRFRENMPGLTELKAKCGDLPVAHVGNPESKAAFDIRYSTR